MNEPTPPRPSAILWIGIAVGVLGMMIAIVGAVLAVLPGASVGESGTSAEQVPSNQAPVEQETEAEDVELAIPAATGISSLPAEWWVAENSARTDIPERALAAYAGAAMRVSDEHPGCGIDWTTLAGIGHVESGHGTIHGGTIGHDGQQTPAIVGIALDGNGVNAIHDTDGGLLDGDTVWDRAVGPMQLIPDTWRQYAADGNEDGTADPQQIDDAALTAARYLCAVGVDLRTSHGWIAAVGAYNDTVDYNNRVADATSYYRGSGS